MSYESILCLWKTNRPSLEIDQIREPYTEAYLKCAGKVRASTKVLGVDFMRIEFNPEYFDYANKWLLKANEGNICLDEQI